MKIQYYRYTSPSNKEIFVYRKKEDVYEYYCPEYNWTTSQDQSNDQLTPITKEEALIELL